MDSEKFNMTGLSSLVIQQLKPGESNILSLQGVLQVGLFTNIQSLELARTLRAANENIRIANPESKDTRGVIIYIVDGGNKGLNLWDGLHWVNINEGGGGGGGSFVLDGDISENQSIVFSERVGNVDRFEASELSIRNSLALSIDRLNDQLKDKTDTASATLSTIYNLQTIQFGSAIDTGHSANVGIVMLNDLISQVIYKYKGSLTTVFSNIQAVGSSSPSAVVEVNCDSGALLVSRLTEAQKLALDTPVNGMIIYNATNNYFEFYENGLWVKKDSGGGGGDGNVRGPETSTPGNLVSFHNDKGTVIADTGVSLNDLGNVRGADASVTDGLVVFNGVTGKSLKQSGILSTNLVTSAASSVDRDIAIFDGVSGKLIKDSGLSLPVTNGLTGQLLSTRGDGTTEWVTISPTPSPQVQTDFYPTAGTYEWKKIPGSTRVRIIMIGGGGGGACNPFLDRSGNGGAGGARFVSGVLDAATFSTTATVIVGAGGKGGIGVSRENDGQNGQDSSFGTTYIAKGGAGGTLTAAPATPGTPNTIENTGGAGGKGGIISSDAPVMVGGNSISAGGGGGGAFAEGQGLSGGNGGATQGFFPTSAGLGGKDGSGTIAPNANGAPGGDGIGWLPSMGSAIVSGPGGGGGGASSSGSVLGNGGIGGNGGLFGGGGGAGGGAHSSTLSKKGNGGNGGGGCVIVYQW